MASCADVVIIGNLIDGQWTCINGKWYAYSATLRLSSLRHAIALVCFELTVRQFACVAVSQVTKTPF